MFNMNKSKNEISVRWKMTANLIFRLLQTADAQDSSWNCSPPPTAFFRIQTMSYCSNHTQHRQNVVTTKLLLIYSLNFVPNKSFQYWRVSSSRVAKCSFFLSQWYRNVYHAEMLVQVKTEFHLIMDDFKNLWTMPAILCRQTGSFLFPMKLIW